MGADPVRGISETELVLPSGRPAVYLAWAMWLSGDASLGFAGDAPEAAWSKGSWKDRFLAGVAVPSVGEQATGAERAGAASVSPVIRGEPQLFAQALPLLDRAHVPETPGGDVSRDDLSALHSDIREAWAALVASFPPAEQAKNESVFNAGFDAFRRGDLATIQQWFAQDAVLTVPGRTPYSGTYRGLSEILALLTLASDRLGIDSPDLTDMEPDGETLVATFTTSVRRGGRSHDVRFRQRFWFNDEGQIARTVLSFENQDDLDAFFGTVP